MKRVFSVLLMLLVILVMTACQPDVSPENNQPSSGEPSGQEDVTIKDSNLFTFTFITYSGESTPTGQIFFSADELTWEGQNFSHEFVGQGLNHHHSGTFDSDDSLSFEGTLSDDGNMIENFSFTYERKGSLYEYNEMKLVGIPAIESSEEGSFEFFIKKSLNDTILHIEKWRSGDLNYEFVKDTGEVLESAKRLSDTGEVLITFDVIR
jgi:hypothetical protein